MQLSLRLAAFIAILYNSDVLGLSLPMRRASGCNGHVELCERPYGNTTFLGSHDSFAFSGNPLALARTQEVDIPNQLKLGVRMLQAQGHLNKDVLHFCHTSCSLFDGGPVEKYLKTVKKFLDENPNEVMTFVFTNPDNLDVEKYWKPAFDKSGMTPLLYVPSSTPMKRDDWPTLGEMIESGQRVIAFLDKGINGTDSDQPDGSFILPEFKMVWEDTFSSTNSSFPCKVDRTEQPLQPTDQLNMINHNLNAQVIPFVPSVLLSDRLNAPKTNGMISILAHANGCTPFTDGRAPNFVLLDYVNIGQGMEAVNQLNGF
ncbi:PLC-like phosphodiesterase [Macrolepiota fuliginosa MF-IS2]|uniref:PLC-like phosphodiesterase n=1 Tax=Macrolepiota fuliginosa MF-IS2 TaxID=1400762 RepID=A0A9P6C4G8_9AGAR|nr:PLC-like phosphodiesterase [Macrolepiota fuliginosa MF-IS2]